MNSNAKNKIYGIGRRKESTAIVEILPSNGESVFEVNGRLADDYFQNNFNYLMSIKAPLTIIEQLNNYKVIANVAGGGLTGQADAIKLGLARALLEKDSQEFRPALKSAGMLSRDSRIKERRKYGFKKARKSSQYSKR